VFFDGTLWRDDEMIRLGRTKTGRAWDMSMSGDNGTIASFRDLGARADFIQSNNSNPSVETRRNGDREAPLEIPMTGWSEALTRLASGEESRAQLRQMAMSATSIVTHSSPDRAASSIEVRFRPGAQRYYYRPASREDAFPRPVCRAALRREWRGHPRPRRRRRTGGSRAGSG